VKARRGGHKAMARAASTNDKVCVPRTELELTGAVDTVVEGHGAGEYTLDGVAPEENVPSRSQTTRNGVFAPAGDKGS
jgi:hypothetical protein